MTGTDQPGMPVNAFRLGVFVVLSITAHCLLLAGWPNTTPRYVPAATNLSVTIVTRQENSTGKKPAETDLKKETVSRPRNEQQNKPTTNAITERPVTAIAETSSPQTEAVDDDVAAPTDPVAVTTMGAESTATPQVALEPAEKPAFSMSQAREQIRAQLHNDLGRFFHYPRLAIMRNWEGTVLLDLMIETDGKISHVSVAKSSGYTLLDNSAIDTLHKVENVGEAARWLQGQSLELQLPVIYRLSRL